MALYKLQKIPSSDATAALELLTSGIFFGRTKFVFDGDDNPIYKGFHINHNADGSETDWIIVKYTWLSDNPTDVQVLKGVWDNRVTLSW